MAFRSFPPAFELCIGEVLILLSPFVWRHDVFLLLLNITYNMTMAATETFRVVHLQLNSRLHSCQFSVSSLFRPSFSSRCPEDQRSLTPRQVTMETQRWAKNIPMDLSYLLQRCSRSYTSRQRAVWRGTWGRSWQIQPQCRFDWPRVLALEK